MQLLCLGDIALADASLASRAWAVPGGIVPGAEAQVLFNWEFPLGAQLNSRPRESGKRFIAYPGSVQMLGSWAPGIAALATNHILDGGEQGLADTIQALQQAGFRTVGAGMTAETAGQPLTWTTGEGRLSIINWVFAETHPDWMAVPGPNCWPGPAEAKRTIEKLKHTSDWVLVVVHWSDELFSLPRPADRALAGELADMGADIVIGHHPHVVRGMEVIGSCPVFYSIGNFHFALTSERARAGTQEAPRNREGLGVRLSFRRGQKPDYELLSFWNDSRESRPDWLGRAARRLKSTSAPLRKYQGHAYTDWYKWNRSLFDRWTARWYFGVMRRGIRGTVQKILERLVKPTLASR